MSLNANSLHSLLQLKYSHWYEMKQLKLICQHSIISSQQFKIVCIFTK